MHKRSLNEAVASCLLSILERLVFANDKDLELVELYNSVKPLLERYARRYN